MKISASIYSDKNRTLAQTIDDLVKHQVDMLHVDCKDNLSVLDDIKIIRELCHLPIDLHIITSDPQKFFDPLRQLQLDYVTFQFEDLKEKVVFPKDIAKELGLAIVTPTDVTVFEQYLDMDFILMMATIPGESGGKFDAFNFQKIRQFKKKFPDKAIHVDGGVNGEVSFILRNMGVRASVSGSFLFKSASVGQALMDLTKREVESQFRISDFMVPLEECPGVEKENMTFLGVLQSIDRGGLGYTMILEEGKFCGIISNADIRRGLIRLNGELPKDNLEIFINPNPITIGANNNVTDLLSIVKKVPFPVLYLPVIDSERNAVGAVTFFDLIKGET